MDNKTIVIGLIVVLLLGTGVYIYNNLINPSQIQVEELSIINSPKPVSVTLVVVHVDGAVRKPGVYRLKHGDRVLDAIEQAGGEKMGADLSILNLAEKIKDGQKITVPSKMKVLGSQSNISSGGKISINSATQKQLESLPGVGAATAKKIIAARPYSKLEDLMKAKSIGKSKFNKLKNKIRL